MDRRKTCNLFAASREVGDYDDVPVLMADFDPQAHLSRNTRPQPFHLICEKDVLLVQLSGEARIDLRSSNVAYFALTPGDHVYVPAGTPHRITPATESVQIRYKARFPGLEEVAWYCPQCQAEIYSETWDTGDVISQQAYWDASQRFNADEVRRTCDRCRAVHPKLDLAEFNWPAIAASIAEQNAAS